MSTKLVCPYRYTIPHTILSQSVMVERDKFLPLPFTLYRIFPVPDSYQQSLVVYRADFLPSLHSKIFASKLVLISPTSEFYVQYVETYQPKLKMDFFMTSVGHTGCSDSWDRMQDHKGKDHQIWYNPKPNRVIVKVLNPFSTAKTKLA